VSQTEPDKDAAENAAQGSLTKVTVTGVLWLTMGRLVKAPINLLVTAILARLLNPADFGIVAIAATVASLANLLVDGSFGMVLVQRREVKPAMIGASLLLSAAMGGIFGLLIIVFSLRVQNFFAFPHLSTVLKLLGVMLPVTAAGAVWSALLQRASLFRILTVNSALAQIVYGSTAIFMAVGGMGVWSLAWAQVLGSGTEAALAFLAGRRRYKIAFSRVAIGEVLSSGGMFTLIKVFNWAASNIDRLILGRLLGAASLGFYSRASTLMATANQLVGAGAMRVLFSTFSRIQHDRPRMVKAFDRALSTTVIGSTLASAFVVMFADVVVRILLGPKWMAAIPLIRVLFVAFVARSSYIVAESVPMSLGLSRATALRQGAQFVLVVAGAMIGARFGLIEAAIGVATAFWLFYLLCLILVLQLLDIGPLRLLRIHLNGVMVTILPVLAALGVEYLIGPTTGILPRLIAPVVFGLVAVIVVALAPERIISEDIARARRQAFELAAARLPMLRAAK
jgi:PST family polysaccharide transporter